MSWNHRVVRRTYNAGKSSQEVAYYIHEAYYGLDATPSITVEPTPPHGDSLAGLKKTLQQMLRALDKPMLDYETREEILDGRVPKKSYWAGTTIPYDQPNPWAV